LKGKDGHYQQKEDRKLIVDFLLIRNFPSALHGGGYKNILLGFMFADIPSVNSLESIYTCSEKPIVYGKLNSLSKKVGKDKFPLIPQIYYPNIKTSDQILIEPKNYPVVSKIGTGILQIIK
jgi:hypothetical protein